MILTKNVNIILMNLKIKKKEMSINNDYVNREKQEFLELIKKRVEIDKLKIQKRFEEVLLIKKI